ncbi:hypothetical protein DRJ00_09485 [Candidatus Aerophobetes bacterium]|uniref:Uncharacterized protein n=1 Tax=Aerophobetes bacterium TaxID=2030807 RepID=A0A497E185_UNCAE|nr:MAG: hypothetical protein DRJ00_09485 [Candidatus Aerophobetes bacterium]
MKVTLTRKASMTKRFILLKSKIEQMFINSTSSKLDQYNLAKQASLNSKAYSTGKYSVNLIIVSKAIW